MLSNRDVHPRGLQLQLFGAWCLRDDGAQVRLVGRAQRLIALLALRGQRTRPHLAGVLWPDTTEERALTSLRAAVLQTQRAVPRLIDADRSQIALHPGVQVDVHELTRYAARALEVTPVDAQGAIRALTGPDLLSGWYDDWVIAERERLQHQRLRALERVAETSLIAHDPGAAATAAREAIAIEPLLESVRSLAIRAHLQAGNRAAAVREFVMYRRLLERELHIGPSPVLVELVRHIWAAATTEHDRRPSQPPVRRTGTNGSPRRGAALPASTAGSRRPDPGTSVSR